MSEKAGKWSNSWWVAKSNSIYVTLSKVEDEVVSLYLSLKQTFFPFAVIAPVCVARKFSPNFQLLFLNVYFGLLINDFTNLFVNLKC